LAGGDQEVYAGISDEDNAEGQCAVFETGKKRVSKAVAKKGTVVQICSVSGFEDVGALSGGILLNCADPDIAVQHKTFSGRSEDLPFLVLLRRDQADWAANKTP
jgi:hypothetical protein